MIWNAGSFKHSNVSTSTRFFISILFNFCDGGKAVWREQFQLSLIWSTRSTFETVILGHHVYKSTWTPQLGETLVCHEDTRDKAKVYDEHAVGLFKRRRNDMEPLVGHIPIELSSLVDNFLKADRLHTVVAEVTGK